MSQGAEASPASTYFHHTIVLLCYISRDFVLYWFAGVYQPGFDLPRQQTDLCPCGETRTMFHIAESCPLTKLNGSLSRLHSADEVAVSWLTSYGS